MDGAYMINYYRKDFHTYLSVYFIVGPTGVANKNVGKLFIERVFVSWRRSFSTRIPSQGGPLVDIDGPSIFIEKFMTHHTPPLSPTHPPCAPSVYRHQCPLSSSPTHQKNSSAKTSHTSLSPLSPLFPLLPPKNKPPTQKKRKRRKISKNIH